MRLSRLLTLSLPLLSLGLLQAEDHPRSLSLAAARQIALAKHPRITIAELQALAARQVARQVQSAMYPQIGANAGVTAVNDPNNTKMTTLGLPVSSAYNRGSVSLIVSQLITDFGRTSNLTASARLQAQALSKGAEATQAQILVDVDGAYFGTLQSQALLTVAEDTVKTRKLTRDQVAALASNKLKSDLDLSFAEVDYQQAILLQSKSENDVAASFANLAALLADPEKTSYTLTDTNPEAKLPSTLPELTATAVHNRPELAQLSLQRDSAARYARAQRALDYPVISLQATTGALPYHDSSLNSGYAVAGVVINVPIFTGGLNDALQKEANLKTSIADAALRDEFITIQRDVRVAELNMVNARERVDITSKLAEQASKSLDLAKARYDAGTSSIVELSQAQLNKTSADIDYQSARYELMLRRSILAYQIGILKPGDSIHIEAPRVR